MGETFRARRVDQLSSLSDHVSQEPAACALRNAFELKLIELSAGQHDVFERGDIRIGLETHGAEGGEVTLSLLAQDLRDFCLLDFVESDVLEGFASFLLERSATHDATRIRIGPLSSSTCNNLLARLQTHKSNFIFQDAVLSVEPLLHKDRSDVQASKQSLKRALRKAVKSGFTISSECFSVSEMQSLHEERWGMNRSIAFYEKIKAFAEEPYCDCISMKDASGRLIGQQVDFCFFNQRSFYYSVTNRRTYSGIGTALLSESIQRFYTCPEMKLYSFGRGGENYKYRYAQYVRLNHYVLGFRTNDRDVLP